MHDLMSLFQCLKTLKHPAILKHHWSYDNSEEFCMVTEPVRPLESVIKSLDTMEIIAGLYNVVEALVFLHERVSPRVISCFCQRVICFKFLFSVPVLRLF